LRFLEDYFNKICSHCICCIYDIRHINTY